MSKKKKSVDYNAKISQEEFDLIQVERKNRQQNQREMIESVFLNGTLGGLQGRLRLSKSSRESMMLKAQYKDTDAKNAHSGIDDSFKTRGIDQSQNIGYANYQYYTAPINTFS